MLLVHDDSTLPSSQPFFYDLYPLAPQHLFLSSFLGHPFSWLLVWMWFFFLGLHSTIGDCFFAVAVRMSVRLDIRKLGFDLR